MKKSLLAIAIATMFLMSCKKVYTCECTATAGDFKMTVAVDSEEKLSKKDAKAWCEADNGTEDGVTIECGLK